VVAFITKRTGLLRHTEVGSFLWLAVTEGGRRPLWLEASVPLAHRLTSENSPSSRHFSEWGVHHSMKGDISSRTMRCKNVYREKKERWTLSRRCALNRRKAAERLEWAVEVLGVEPTDRLLESAAGRASRCRW
jgi:hypothetical protein